MTPGHILYYFGRKDRILIETLRWSEADLETRRRAALEMAPDPLRTFVELYLPQAQDDVRWRLWTQIWSRPPADPETLEVLETLTWSWRDDLAPILGDPGAATALCYLLDGLTLDVLTGARSRDDAIELGLDAAARYAG
jgi:AcrR family transcriptional regulator